MENRETIEKRLKVMHQIDQEVEDLLNEIYCTEEFGEPDHRELSMLQILATTTSIIVNTLEHELEEQKDNV